MLRVTAHLAAGPSCIYAPAVAPVGGTEVYVFGDSRFREKELSGDQMEVYVFNTVSLRWRTLPPVTLTQRGVGGERPPEAPPPPGIFHTAVLIDCVVYVFGGCDRTTHEYRSVLHAFDVVGHSWSRPEVSGSVPRGRGSHSACASEKVMYVFGGYTKDHRDLAVSTRDIFKLDTGTMVWSFVSVRGTPPPRLTHNCAAFVGTKMFVFGGYSTNVMENHCDSLSVFDIETNMWLTTPPDPLCPVGHMYRARDFLRNGELYVWSIDVWKYTPETSSWKRIKPKGKTVCWTDGMSLCTVGDRIVLFGGRDAPFIGGYGRPGILYILDFNPSLKTLCKLAVIQYGLEQSGLPHDVRWELAAMTTNSS